MEIAFIILIIGFVFANLFLTLQYGSDYPYRPLLYILLIGAVVFLSTTDFFLYFCLLLYLASLSSQIIAVAMLKKHAGNLALTYREKAGSLWWKLVYLAFAVYVAFTMGNPWIELPNGKRLFDESYYRLDLPIVILLVVFGVNNFLSAFRKNEFFENGFATPEMSYLPWKGYKAYEWVQYTEENESRFLLYLESAQNVSHTIEGFSEDDKNILEELLSTKLEKIPKSQK